MSYAQINYKDDCGNKELSDLANESFKILSELFSSQEFQDSISVLKNFACYNIHKNLRDIKCNDDDITGSVILKELYKKQNDSLKLILEIEHRSALGETVPFKNFTTAYFNNIMNDMPNLSFKYALAVNLAHEYMHHIGFIHENNRTNEVKCKPDIEKYDKDIAYRVGWIAFRILSKKYNDAHSQLQKQ